MLNTPILFLVFNRPDTTQCVFAQIRKIQPKQLFVAADGARAGKEGEEEKVAQVRKLILEGIDWDCEVKTLFREENLGCGKAVSQAITWFFDNVEQGIILEDDTLPDLSFFPFCEELLEKYKDDERVMHISGLNFQNKNWGNTSYYFSAYSASIWGWATWRRAWASYDFSMIDLDNFLHESKIHEIIPIPKIAEKYGKILNRVQSGKIDTWDYAWLFNLWLHQGLSIVPNYNMMINIGFDAVQATHTSSIPSFLKKEHDNTDRILTHPSEIARNLEADLDRLKVKYLSSSKQSIFNKAITKLKKIIKQ